MHTYKKKLSRQGIVIIGLTIACVLLIITNLKLQKVALGQNDLIQLLLANQTAFIEPKETVEIEPAKSNIELFIENKLPTLNANEFINAANEFKVDKEIMLASFIWETGWGTHSLWTDSNNAGGIICTYGQCNGEYQVYNSSQEGLNALAGNLAVYNDMGLNSPEEIRNRWAESGYTLDFGQLIEEIRGYNDESLSDNR